MVENRFSLPLEDIPKNHENPNISAVIRTAGIRLKKKIKPLFSLYPNESGGRTDSAFVKKIKNRTVKVQTKKV